MTDSLRIVIVMDDVLLAMDLADLLIAMGHHVCAIARNEADAAAAADRYAPELMVAESTLAYGGGVAAMRRVLAQGFVAHFYVAEHQSSKPELKHDTVIIAKPYTVDKLYQAIVAARAAAKHRVNPAV